MGLNLGHDCDVYRSIFVSLCDCILDLAQGLHRQTCRQVTFILNKIAGLLHLIHVLIEVLIRSHLEQMEIVGDLGQAAATRELLLQHGDLVGFGRVRQRLHLALLVDVELSFALDLLFVPVVPLLLILVTLHHSILCFSSGLIGLQRGHQFVGACNRLVEAAPGLLWLVHERVLLRDLHPLDDVLATDDVLISWCQLEHLV